MTKPQCLLVGAGAMAQAYARVLQDQAVPSIVSGRGEASARRFEEETGLAVRRGGVERVLEDTAPGWDHAIVAAPVDALAPITRRLINAGVRRILVEKPAGLSPGETRELAEAARRQNAEVFVAYNRRFYASALKAREFIREDGGATSLRLEFSEFSHRIAQLPSSPAVKQAWLYANSTHVLDMGFFLAGFPQSMTGLAAGALDWHPAGACFAGHGKTLTGAVFSYHADWRAAPKWMVEIGTPARTLMLQPLETLSFRSNTGFDVTSVELDDTDTRFKPGLWRQTHAFLNGGNAQDGLCDIESHARHMQTVYRTIREGGRTG